MGVVSTRVSSKVRKLIESEDKSGELIESFFQKPSCPACEKPWVINDTGTDKLSVRIPDSIHSGRIDNVSWFLRVKLCNHFNLCPVCEQKLTHK